MAISLIKGTNGGRYLSGNQLTGSLPEQWSALTGMKEL
jgi:hypothetical protein